MDRQTRSGRGEMRRGKLNGILGQYFQNALGSGASDATSPTASDTLVDPAAAAASPSADSDYGLGDMAGGAYQPTTLQQLGGGDVRSVQAPQLGSRPSLLGLSNIFSGGRARTNWNVANLNLAKIGYEAQLKEQLQNEDKASMLQQIQAQGQSTQQVKLAELANTLGYQTPQEYFNSPEIQAKHYQGTIERGLLDTPEGRSTYAGSRLADWAKQSALNQQALGNAEKDRTGALIQRKGLTEQGYAEAMSPQTLAEQAAVNAAAVSPEGQEGITGSYLASLAKGGLENQKTLSVSLLDKANARKAGFEKLGMGKDNPDMIVPLPGEGMSISGTTTLDAANNPRNLPMFYDQTGSPFKIVRRTLPPINPQVFNSVVPEQNPAPQFQGTIFPTNPPAQQLLDQETALENIRRLLRNSPNNPYAR